MIWYQIKADISINITIIGRAILIWFVFQSAVPQFFRVIMDEGRKLYNAQSTQNCLPSLAS